MTVKEAIIKVIEAEKYCIEKKIPIENEQNKME